MRLAASLVGICAIAIPASAAAQDADGAENPPESVEDLSGLTIEELARVTVRSASKREEPLSAAPTALYVLTGEEILATAANSIPEALRLAPNLGVQQIDARQYAITARGFNSFETSNKLLVLIDGRSVYTPLHSGVFWQLHNRPLEDIRQIEVISGPGGTLYGPNAVNGVVSIVTRDARDTVGVMARGTAGPWERTAAARFGMPVGGGALRVYGAWFEREDLAAGFGPVRDDSFRGWQAGFRADFASENDHFTLQGDIFDNESGGLPGDGNEGHNLLARWTHAFDAGTSLQVQAYHDRFDRRFTLVRDRLETFDAEAQLTSSSGAHDFVAGIGVRTTRDLFANNLNPFQLDPQSRRLWVYNLFAQDRIRLSPQVSLIAGIKVERSSFTGFELLPNLRVAWQPDGRTLVWAAVSRAVRTPSRIDRELVNLPLLATSPGFRSEKLVAFEAGYRGRPIADTNLSVSFFFNLYDDIRTTEFTGNPLPIRLLNGLQGYTWGVEAWSRSQLAPWWRLDLGLATIWKDFRLDPGSVDLADRDSLGHDPDWQLLARSHFDLTERLRFNAGVRLIDDIDSAPPLGSYAEADARLGYMVTQEIELYLAGTNLLRDSHVESNDPQRSQRPRRSLYGGARARF